MAIEWGSLKHYEGAANALGAVFWDTYDKCRLEARYLGDLPLSVRGWRINFIEAKHVLVVINFRPFTAPSVATEYEAYPQSIYPALASFDTVDEIARYLRLGSLADSRLFPSGLPTEYSGQVIEWAKHWATELANEHMARTHPDFAQAQQRMTDAYYKLFELEHYLRELIEQQFRAKYGDECWDKTTPPKPKISPKVVKTVTRNQNDPRDDFIDDYGTSILRFAEFPNLRQLIAANWTVLRSVFGDSNTSFKSRMSSLEPTRNRIAHVNTLSSDDFHDFNHHAEALLANIRPHVQLR